VRFRPSRNRWEEQEYQTKLRNGTIKLEEIDPDDLVGDFDDYGEELEVHTAQARLNKIRVNK